MASIDEPLQLCNDTNAVERIRVVMRHIGGVDGFLRFDYKLIECLICSVS